MIGIHYKKESSEHYCRVLASGHGDIHEPSGGWTAHEMLTLAGACCAVVIARSATTQNCRYRYKKVHAEGEKFSSQQLTAIFTRD